MFTLSEQTIKAFQAMSYPEAYQQFKNDLRENDLNLEIVADRLDWKWNKLEKKLTPSHDWQLSFHELVLICQKSGVFTLLFWAVAQSLEVEKAADSERVPALTPQLALELMAAREKVIARLTGLLVPPQGNYIYSAIDARLIHDAAMDVVERDLAFLRHLEPLLSGPGCVRMAVRFEDLQEENGFNALNEIDFSPTGKPTLRERMRKKIRVLEKLWGGGCCG